MKEYGKEMIWHVPERPYDTVNSRFGIGAGVSFPNEYVMKVGVQHPYREHRLCYYQRTVYDDTQKRTHYILENTGNMVVIGQTGVLRSRNAELNYFLAHCPWNGNNDMRDNQDQPYRESAILFKQYKPEVRYNAQADAASAIHSLYRAISPNSDSHMPDRDVLISCQSIVDVADRPVPNAIIEWRNYSSEEGLPALRNALLDLAMREPLWLKAVIIEGRRTKIRQTLSKALELGTELTGFGYDNEKKMYYTTNKKGEKIPFVEVPGKHLAEKYIVDSLYSDSKLLYKLEEMIAKAELAQKGV